MASITTIEGERREAARRRLAGYRTLVDIQRQMMKVVESAESRLTATTAQYDEMRASSCASDAMAEQIALLEEQVARLNGIVQRQARALDETLSLIYAIADAHPTEARVLARRYLEPGFEPSFREIGDFLGITEDYARHVHMRALDLVAGVLASV